MRPACIGRRIRIARSSPEAMPYIRERTVAVVPAQVQSLRSARMPWGGALPLALYVIGNCTGMHMIKHKLVADEDADMLS